MAHVSHQMSIRLVFGLNGLGIALWFPRIPDVKAALAVDLLTLSLCFFMLPLGTIIGFFVAPDIVARLGARRVCWQIGPVFILLFILPALAGSAVQLGAALLLAGLTIASIEVAMNGKAAEIERSGARRIMSSCHGFWSLGSMTGALIGGAAAGLEVSFVAQQLVLAPLFAGLAWAVARKLPADLPGLVERTGRARLSVPTGALLLVCLMPMGALMIEGAMMEWSALFLRGTVGLGPFQAAVIFGGFSVAMATCRFAGDRMLERFGAARVLSASCVMAGVGMAGFALAPGLGIALPAAVVLGLGAANVYPLAMSLAAELPGRPPEDSIAVVAFAAFTVYLVSPPLIGGLGSLLGLGSALLCLVPAALYPLVMMPPSLAPTKRNVES